MLYLIIALIVLVVGYHYVDKGNFYSALHASKDTGKVAYRHTKEIAGVTGDAVRASHSLYQEEILEHEVEYAKAGKDYQAEQLKRDLARARAIQATYAPVRESLQDTTKVSKENRTRLEKELLTLQA